MTQTVIGIFAEKAQAEEALAELEDEGYNVKDMSIIMKHREEADEVSKSTGARVETGAAEGAATGAVIGGLAGLLIGVGAIAIPGIGGLLVAGPLVEALGLTGAAATTVSGAVTGGIAGGLIGALVNLGLPEDRAREYEEGIKRGGILLAIPSQDENVRSVRSILQDHHADNVDAVTVGKTPAHEDDEHHHHQHFHGGDLQQQTKHGDGHKHANPVQVQKFLKHVDYPATKDTLIHTAEKEGADDIVLHTLEDLPDEKFESPKVVAQAIGGIE